MIFLTFSSVNLRSDLGRQLILPHLEDTAAIPKTEMLEDTAAISRKPLPSHEHMNISRSNSKRNMLYY